jgi:hypothetical protein
MVHVGLNSVGTYHKKFGWENKINKNVLCRVSRDDTRQRSLCRVSAGWHSTKKFENPTSDLCRVLVRRHSAKTSLPSVRSRALGKEYFKLKKSLSSARSWALGKEVKYTPDAAASFSFSISLTHSAAHSLSLTGRRRCRCFGSDCTPGVAPQGVFRSRTVSPTVAKWFVPDARGTMDSVYRFRPLWDV